MSVAAEILDLLAQRGVTVRRVRADSRRVEAGDVFLAFPGETADGRDYLADALERGAAAVVAQTAGYTTPIVVNESPVIVAVHKLDALAGEIAHLVYGRPSEKMWLAGVTGTNGKTSTTQWIAQALAALTRKCAVIGTLGNGFAPDLEVSPNTTPDAVTLHSALARYLEQGAVACAMEVSSIGMDQSRVSGAAFDVAVFTNLTRDHLDYHGTMEAYAECKEAFFRVPGLKTAVINLDDPFGASLAAKLKGKVQVIGYTLEGGHPVGCADQMLQAEAIAMGSAGVAFTVNGQAFRAPVVGRFNIANLLAVIGALLAKGEALSDIATAVAQLKPPPGRMEIVELPFALSLSKGVADFDRLSPNGQADERERKPLVVVDYSHTPDALEKALGVLRETATARGGKLVCVFGCGGERDPGKRPQMGAIAENLADRVIVTADNPRGEDVQKILVDIVAGMRNSARVLADRREAIHAAVSEAAPTDVILLAGKGHETYQEIAGVKHPFSDLVVAREALEQYA